MIWDLFLGLTNLWPNSTEAAVEKELKSDPISALNQQVIWITLISSNQKLEEYVIQFWHHVLMWYSVDLVIQRGKQSETVTHCQSIVVLKTNMLLLALLGVNKISCFTVALKIHSGAFLLFVTLLA